MGSKKRRKKGQQRTGTCAYCGYDGPITRDHVIPKALFTELDQDMVTVPACAKCQRAKAGGDRDLEVFVTLDIFGSHHPDMFHHAQKIVQRNENTRKWLMRVLDAAEEVSLVTDEGIELSQGLKIDFNFDRIMVMMNMAVRGLYFSENQDILPKTIPTEVIRVPWNMGLETLQRLGAFRVGDPIVKGNRVAWWKSIPVEDVSKDSTLWVLCFNDAVVFLGGTGDLASRLSDQREEVERRRIRGSEKIHIPSSVRPRAKLPKDWKGNYILPPMLREPD